MLLTLPYSSLILLLPAILIIIIVITLYSTFFSSCKNYKSQSSVVDPSKYPPGRTGWPIVGETLLFYSAGRKGAPENFIRERMNKFSPKIFRTSLLGEPMAVLCGAAGNKFLFSMGNSWWPKSLAKIFPIPQNSSSDQVARKLGNLIRQFLKPESLKRYIPVMDIVVQEHLEANWDQKKEILTFPLTKNFTFMLACRLFLGIDDPARVEKLREPFDELIPGIYSFPIDLPGTQCNRAIKATKYITNELLGIVKQRKIDLAADQNKASSSRTQDILSDMLLTADDEDDGQFMNELAIVNMILGFLIASHDTVSSAITSIIMFLAELPQVYNQVRKEQLEIAKGQGEGELLNWDDMKKMKYSWNVACEVMRLAPPVQGAFRETITDFNYQGFSIPKEWKLYWSVNSTHKNPDYFKEPEKFDPTRFEGSGPKPFTYVPFGGGSRMCPGNEYARLEILAFIYHIVTRYKWEKILPDEKIVVDPLPMPAKRLPLRLYPQTQHC